MLHITIIRNSTPTLMVNQLKQRLDLTSSHGTLPDRKAHMCAWCVYKYKKVKYHKEIDWNNKKRAQEKRVSTDTVVNVNSNTKAQEVKQNFVSQT